jgi:hypothetical protein
MYTCFIQARFKLRKSQGHKNDSLGSTCQVLQLKTQEHKKHRFLLAKKVESDNVCLGHALSRSGVSL